METALVPTIESVSPKLTSLLSPKASYLMHGKGFSNLLINQHVSCKKVNQGNQIKKKEINFHIFDEIAIAEGCFNYDFALNNNATFLCTFRKNDLSVPWICCFLACNFVQVYYSFCPTISTWTDLFPHFQNNVDCQYRMF